MQWNVDCCVARVFIGCASRIASYVWAYANRLVSAREPQGDHLSRRREDEGGLAIESPGMMRHGSMKIITELFETKLCNENMRR
jgi:hypothetical protein